MDMSQVQTERNAYCEITPEIKALEAQWEKHSYIDPCLLYTSIPVPGRT